MKQPMKEILVNELSDDLLSEELQAMAMIFDKIEEHNANLRNEIIEEIS